MTETKAEMSFHDISVLVRGEQNKKKQKFSSYSWMKALMKTKKEEKKNEMRLKQ